MKKTFILLSSLTLIAYFAAFYNYAHQLPFQRDFLQGDAAYHVNINHNISQNHSPESTLWSNGANWESYKNNPFIGKKTDYTSSLLFWGRSAFTPAILVPFLYSFSPAPPMHILAIVIIVLLFGYIGIATATYKLTASYAASFVASFMYLMCPWVVHELFERGFWDIIGYGIFPLVLSTVLHQRWVLFGLSAALFAGISIPVAALTLCVTGAVFIFYRKYGVCFFVGAVSCLLIIMASYMYPFCTADHVINNTGGFLSHNFPNILLRFQEPQAYLSKIFFSLFEGIGKQLILPLILILFFANKKQRTFVLFASAIALMGYAMILAREGSHRNYFFVTPAFFVGLMGSSILYQRLRILKIPGIALAAFTLTFMPHFFTDTVNRIDGLYVISYATGLKQFTPQEREEQKNFQKVVDEVERMVPKDKGLVFGDMRQLEGSLCNRTYCWYLGYHPKGAEFFLVQDPALIDSNQMELVKQFEKPFPLFLFKNINGNGFSRKEEIIGFEPLKRAFHL